MSFWLEKEAKIDIDKVRLEPPPVQPMEDPAKLLDEAIRREAAGSPR